MWALAGWNVAWIPPCLTGISFKDWPSSAGILHMPVSLSWDLNKHQHFHKHPVLVFTPQTRMQIIMLTSFWNINEEHTQVIISGSGWSSLLYFCITPAQRQQHHCYRKILLANCRQQRFGPPQLLEEWHCDWLRTWHHPSKSSLQRIPLRTASCVMKSDNTSPCF